MQPFSLNGHNHCHTETGESFFMFLSLWLKLRTREREGVSLCSGPRVDKQHSGNWSVNIAVIDTTPQPVGNFTFYYRSVKLHFTDPHTALTVCAGGIWVEGGALEACFDRSSLNIHPIFTGLRELWRKLSRFAMKSPSGGIWECLRIRRFLFSA